MLALSRNINESIVISDTESGETIRVMVIGMKGRSGVKLAFEASARFHIDREEVLNAKRAATEGTNGKQAEPQ